MLFRSSANFAAVAKSVGLTSKTSEPFARAGSLPDVGSARQIPDAFTLSVGAASPAKFLGSRWVIFRVAAREEAKPEDLVKQRAEIENFLLNSKRQAAYDAFRKELEDRMTKAGKLQYNQENLRRLTSAAS